MDHISCLPKTLNELIAQRLGHRELSAMRGVSTLIRNDMERENSIREQSQQLQWGLLFDSSKHRLMPVPEQGTSLFRVREEWLTWLGLETLNLSYKEQNQLLSLRESVGSRVSVSVGIGTSPPHDPQWEQHFINTSLLFYKKYKDLTPEKVTEEALEYESRLNFRRQIHDKPPWNGLHPDSVSQVAAIEGDFDTIVEALLHDTKRSAISDRNYSIVEIISWRIFCEQNLREKMKFYLLLRVVLEMGPKGPRFTYNPDGDLIGYCSVFGFSSNRCRYLNEQIVPMLALALAAGYNPLYTDDTENSVLPVDPNFISDLLAYNNHIDTPISTAVLDKVIRLLSRTDWNPHLLHHVGSNSVLGDIVRSVNNHVDLLFDRLNRRGISAHQHIVEDIACGRFYSEDRRHTVFKEIFILKTLMTYFDIDRNELHNAIRTEFDAEWRSPTGALLLCEALEELTLHQVRESEPPEGHEVAEMNRFLS